eukprot:SAG31_NODE_35518_length_322_cov_0.825112_1_plen_47_part_10
MIGNLVSQIALRAGQRTLPSWLLAVCVGATVADGGGGGGGGWMCAVR